MIAAIDFDGTLVEHAYPHIGAEIPQAFEWLRRLQDAGVRLILWTMRSGETLDQAVTYCSERGITFWGVNENPDQRETGWSTSPKAFAQAYVDDYAIGAPLTIRPGCRRACVNWDIAGPLTWNAVGLPLGEVHP